MKKFKTSQKILDEKIFYYITVFWKTFELKCKDM